MDGTTSVRGVRRRIHLYPAAAPIVVTSPGAFAAAEIPAPLDTTGPVRRVPLTRPVGSASRT